MSFPRPKNFSYVDLNDVRVIDDINNHLNVKLAEPLITPYVALERARKTLAPYGIVIPAVAWMNSDDGEQVFPVYQWGGLYGTKGVASVDTDLKANATYSVYFSWSYVAGKNAYEVYCAVVNQEELNDLLTTDFDGSPVPHHDEEYENSDKPITYPNVNAAVHFEEKKKLRATTDISLVEATEAFVRRTEAARASLLSPSTISEDDDPCWDDYRMVGMKKKGGREVPNCVPKKGVPKMRKEDAESDRREDEEYDNNPAKHMLTDPRKTRKIHADIMAQHQKNADQNAAEADEEERRRHEADPDLKRKEREMVDKYHRHLASRPDKSGKKPTQKMIDARHRILMGQYDKALEQHERAKKERQERIAAGKEQPEKPVTPEMKAARERVAAMQKKKDAERATTNEEFDQQMDEALSPPDIRYSVNHGDNVAREHARGYKKAATAYNDAFAKVASQRRTLTREQEDELANHYERALHHQREFKKRLAQLAARKNEDINEGSAAWQRKEGKNPEGGLNRKGVESYRRENPGSKLQMAVTTKPSKLKPGSKAANRRKSFCARMGGMPGPMKDEKGRPTRKALSLRKWNC